MSDGDAGRAWATSISNRIGEAVRLRRQELGLSAQGVADRTVELGYPITRATISKIENGNRGGKVEVAELLVLAEVLEVSPAALVWWDAPDGQAQPLPGLHTNAGRGFEMFTGTDPRTDALKQVLESRETAVNTAILNAQLWESGSAEFLDNEELHQRATIDAFAAMRRAERQAAHFGWTIRDPEVGDDG